MSWVKIARRIDERDQVRVHVTGYNRHLVLAVLFGDNIAGSLKLIGETVDVFRGQDDDAGWLRFEPSSKGEFQVLALKHKVRQIVCRIPLPSDIPQTATAPAPVEYKVDGKAILVSIAPLLGKPEAAMPKVLPPQPIPTPMPTSTPSPSPTPTPSALPPPQPAPPPSAAGEGSIPPAWRNRPEEQPTHQSRMFANGKLTLIGNYLFWNLKDKVLVQRDAVPLVQALLKGALTRAYAKELVTKDVDVLIGNLRTALRSLPFVSIATLDKSEGWDIVAATKV